MNRRSEVKTQENHRPAVREPRQERSRHKVQLIFEATTRLLEKSAIEVLTTNAVAASAGVSIGTLYQFFPNKEAILDGLADREFAKMADRVTRAMQDADIATPEARIAALVRAVAASYGTRHRAHRAVMEYSLARGGNRLGPLLANVMAQLTTERKVGPIRHAITKADAFVLVHAFGGVLRAMTRENSNAPPLDEITGALTRLVTRFV